MELLSNQPGKLSFKGNGSDFFIVYFTNILLTIITLGIYYSWAKVNILKYQYQETEFAESRFAFHGKGIEIFIGILKTLGLFIILLLPAFIGFKILSFYLIIFGVILFPVGILLFVPLALHGALRYRLSRTSWRGIHFGYRGNRWMLMGKFFGGMFLTIITLGIYASWYVISLRKYIIGHIRFGSAQFRYVGKGLDYFVLNLVGVLLSMLTLGIYMFWFAKNLFNFYVENIEIVHNEKVVKLKATATAGQVFKTFVGNFFLLIITLGLAYPLVKIRTLRFVFNNVEIDPSFDANALVQTEEDYKDATGDDMLSFLDISLI